MKIINSIIKFLDWFLSEGNSELSSRVRYKTTAQLILEIKRNEEE